MSCVNGKKRQILCSTHLVHFDKVAGLYHFESAVLEMLWFFFYELHMIIN